MTDVLAIAIALSKAENLVGKCGRLVGLIGDNQMGAQWSVPPMGRATDAYNASRDGGYIDTHPDFNNLAIGGCAYYEYPDAKNNGHMGIIVGPDLMLSMTANKVGMIQDYGRGLFLSSISGYGRPFLGVSPRMATRAPITGLTSQWARAPLAPNQREVLGTKGLNIRSNPTQSGLVLGSLPRGGRFSPVGFRPDGETVAGVSLWYAIAHAKGTDGIAWVWAGGATEASGHDLRDLTPPPVVVEPPKPVVHTVTFGLPNGEIAVEVEHGEVVAPAAVPTPPYTTGYQFEGWLLAEDDPTVMPNTEIDLSTYRVLEDVLLHAWYKQEVIEPGEPEVPQVPQVPVVDPQLQNLDDAATILADAASPWLSSGVRARVYEVATIGVAACGSIAGVAGAVVLVVGSDSQVGTVAGTTALIAAAVGGALGTFAARLARQNTPLEAATRLEAQGDELGVRTVAKIRAANSK